MQLYNTLTRDIEEFKPIDPDNVRIYTCGPTVYREIHIGNLRTYLTTDILKRILLYNGYKVTSVMNITDVGHMRTTGGHNRQIDPIIEEAISQGKQPLDIAKYYSDKFFADEKRLNISPADIRPKATGHIKEMIEIIKILIDKGFAYQTDGNVYFKVNKFKDYGKLSGNTLDKMDQLLEAVRVSVETDKKNSIDFALWKKADFERLMKWESPWGEGFPGWHIECSAMSIKYLGETFDVHAGGEDLIFPHHEDEIAQAESYSGKKFVNYWVHSNYLLVDDEKMSRSKRNVYTISDIQMKKFHPLAFRYLTYLTHYRTRMNFTWGALQSAQTALDKLYALASEFGQPQIACAKYEQEFYEAINQDLNMPKAVSIMWEMLRSKEPASAKAQTLHTMDEVLGLKIKENVNSRKVIPDEIRQMCQERERLRREKRFGLADQLRHKIEKLGYNIKDSKGETKVSRKT